MMVRIGLAAGLVVLGVLLMGCGGSPPMEGVDATDVNAEQAPGDAPSNLMTLRPVADTHVDSIAHTTNYGTATELFIGTKNSRGRSLLRFKTVNIPTSATVDSAYLWLYVTWYEYQPDTYAVHRVTGTWTEMGATWDTAPTFGATPSVTKVIDASAVGHWVKINVKKLVQSWVTTPSRNFGCLVKGSEPGGNVAFKATSREGVSSQRPRLVVNYTP
jgi:hypothetical protein